MPQATSRFPLLKRLVGTDSTSGTVTPSALAVFGFMCCRSHLSVAGAVQVFLAKHPLATVVEDDDAGADVFCAPGEPARFDIFDNDREAKSVVQRISNPMMLLRDITEVNSTMVVRHGVIAARIGRPADKLKCVDAALRSSRAAS